MANILLRTEMHNFGKAERGKVRDKYNFGEEMLLVTTDRLSAFDVVLEDGIPGKGVVLNQISNFWFKMFEDLVLNHLRYTDAGDFPITFSPYIDQIKDRSVIVKRSEPLPIECIVRGYITGSGWKSYEKDGTICGVILPRGLQESEKLLNPIYTPSTKAEQGEHDVNISFLESTVAIEDWLREKFKEMAIHYGDIGVALKAQEIATEVANLSLILYKKGAEFALKKGIIIADTKFEFGLEMNENTGKTKIILIDEVLTPDSSRFWPLNDYKIGQAQDSFDKQIIRDYLIKTLKWDKKVPAPKLPKEIIKLTEQKYKMIKTLLVD